MIFCRENDRKKKNKIVSVFLFFLFGAFEIILNNVIIYHCGTSFFISLYSGSTLKFYFFSEY